MMIRCFLSKIRHEIGKNTKFKSCSIWDSRTLFFLQNFSSFLFLSFIIFSLVFTVSIVSSSPPQKANNVVVTNRIVQKSFETFMFRDNSGFVRVSSSDRPRLESESDDDNVSNLQRNTKVLIAKQVVDKYKKSAIEIHPYFKENDVEANYPYIIDKNTSSSQNESEHARLRRAIIFAELKPDLARRRRKVVNHESEGTFVINQVDRAKDQYYDGINSIDINCQRIEDQTFVFSIERTEEGRELMMHQLNEKNFQQSLTYQTKAPDAVSVDIFKIKGDWFAFSTVNHKPQATGSAETINIGSELYRVDLSTYTLQKKQTIHLPFAKTSTFWTGMGDEANEVFLAIAPEKTFIDSEKTSYSVNVPCYRWQGGYFDYVSQLPASNPQSIQHFSMFSHDYLAVSNYQDDTGSTNIQSEIFKYLHKESRFVSFQRIQTFGAKDIRHFTFTNADERRQEHFIAIANSCKRDENGKSQYWVQSSIMKFGSLRYHSFKNFYSYGALQFLPVKNGDKFFLTLADFHGIRMFQYNGWTFVETFSQKYATQQNSPFSISLRQWSNDGKSYFTVATETKDVENGMFAVNFETRNDHRKLLSSVELWCNGANILSKRNLNALESQLDSAPWFNASRVIVKGTLKFDEGVEVGELKSQALRLGRGKSLDDDQFKAMAKNERDFNAFFRHLNFLETKMDTNVVWVNKDNDVNGNVNFINDVVYQNEDLHVSNLNVQKSIDSIKVSDHLNNLIFTNQPTQLKSIVTDIVFADDIAVTSLNERQLNSYALRQPSTNQMFTGKNEFRSPVQVTKVITVGNSFAGLAFTEPQFLLYQGNQTFPGVTMDLTGSKVENLYTKILNGHNVHSMFADAVPLSGGVIKAEKRFSKVQIKRAKVTNMNNVNIDTLYKDAIYTKGKSVQSFEESVHFENMEIQEINPVNRNINGAFDLATTFIKIEGGNYELTNMKIEKSTKIDNLFVQSQLNQVKVFEDLGKLDLFLKTSTEPQHIKSKRLKSIHFNENVMANDLVDGVDLATWSEVQKIQLTQNTMQGTLSTVGNMKAEGGLFVGESFKQGKSDVLHVLENSARTDSNMLLGSCDLHFDSLTVNGNSDVRGTVNKVTPAQWVVNSADSEHLDINGEKTFANGLHIDKDCEANGLFGKVEDTTKKENLMEVFPTLLLDGFEQTITDEMTFKSLRADTASCPNAILNEVPFENLLFKKGNQIVEVDTTFRGPLTTNGDVSVLDDMSTVLINDININHQLKNTLRTNSKNVQTITAAYEYEEITADKAMVNGLLATSDVDSLFGNIVQKNSKEIKLNGMSLTFGKGATLSKVEFLGRVNGISSHEWGNAWLLSRGDQIVETKVQFAGPVTANSFEAPFVNGENINELSSSILRIDRDETIQGGAMMNFMNAVTAEAGIATGKDVKVNDMDLLNDVLLKNSDKTQTINGATMFKNGMTIKGNLDVNKVEGFDMANFADLVNGGTTPSVQSGTRSLIVSGNLMLENEPEVTSNINDKNWNDILQEYWLKDKNVVLGDPVEFSSLDLQNGGSMKDSTKMNGIELKMFQNNYASKSKSQTWTGNVILGSVKNIHDITSKSLVLENNGKFNDVDIKEFNESVLKYDGDQEIQSDLEANEVVLDRLNTINDASINSVQVKDLMTISGPNKVSEKKHLKSLQTKRLSLSPATVIDGVNMGEWDKNAVRLTGSHDIKGPVNFKTLQTTENVKVDGMVDGIKYNLQNVLTSDKDQEILGKVVIKQPNQSLQKSALVKAPAGVEFKGKVNGINVQDSIANLVFPSTNDNTPIRIKGTTMFSDMVVISQVKAEALVQGHNVTDVAEKMTRAHTEVHKNAFIASDQYGELLRMTRKMVEASEKRAVFLNYYVLTQTIDVPATYVKPLRDVGYPAVAIGFKKSNSVTTENWWSYSSAVDYYQLQIGNRVQLQGVVSDMAELSHDGSSVFAFAVNSEESSRPAQAVTEVMDKTIKNFEIDKSPDKLSKTFILKSVDPGTPNMRPAISQVIYSEGFKSIESFTVKGENGLNGCMAATNVGESSLKIFCMDNTSGTLAAVQEMPMDSPSLTTSTSIASSDMTLLGILTRSGKDRPEGLLEIWSHSPSNEVKFAKQSCLPVFNAVSLDSLSTEDGKTLLVVASGALRAYEGSVFVYRYSSQTHQFQKIQTIEVNHPTDVKLQWLKPSNEVVMYILSRSLTNNVQAYKRQGLSGWILVHQFTAENARSLEVNDFNVDGIYRAQVFAISQKQVNVYAAEFMGLNTVIEEEIMESSQSSHTSLREFIDFDNL